MLRMGRSNKIYSGTLTWSAGSTATSAQTFSISVPASAGLTTLMHEVILYTDWTASLTCDFRPTISAGATVYLDISKTVTVSAVTTVKGLAIAGISTISNILFNNASLSIACVLSGSASSTVTLSCLVQEIEGCSPT